MLHVQRAEERDVAELELRTLERAFRRANEVLQARLVELLLHRRGIVDVEEGITVVHVHAPAARDLDVERQRTVGDAVRSKELVARPALDEQRSSRPVAEVEHEPRALVPVIEQVRLAAGSDEEHVLQVALGNEHVARHPQRDRRPAGDVVVLDRIRVHGADAMGDPRRRLPDGVVLPHRAEVHDHVDRFGIDTGFIEQRLAGAHRHVADVLVIGRDVLAAQRELLDEHLLRNAARNRHLRGRHPALRQIRGGRRQRDARHAPSTRSISIPICSSSSSGTSSAPSHTIQRIPSSSPMPISAQASTSGSMRATSPRSIADSRAAT